MNEPCHIDFYCSTCNYSCSKKSLWNSHIKTNKHLSNQKQISNLKAFNCKACNYECIKKSLWLKHISTIKHLSNDKNTTKSFICGGCKKSYKSNSGLWLHKKKCDIEEEKEKDKEEGPEFYKDTIVNMIQEQKEFKQIIMDQNNKLIELYSKPNSITNNNNKFNLNFFLNEQCKDAMSLMDFVHSLQLGIRDLENTAKLGYVEGITKIIVDGLKEMDLHKRPIHCTDVKREIIYIKDQDTWEKEDEDKAKLKKAIDVVSHKNIQQIPIWHAENPECMDISHEKSNEYLNIMIQANGGSSRDEMEKNSNKIIKNIAKVSSI